MTNIEIAEAIKDTNMYELACKTNAELDLTDSEKVTVSQLDAYFKKVGERGSDPDCEIAAFVRKAINEEIYNAPDELLDFLFNRDTIGEFDDFEGVTDPKNTLVAYETAKGANVKRSFLDIGVLSPQWVNFQIETDISYKDLRKSGWKTVSLITENAVAAFKNKMFKFIFDKIDAGIATGAENCLNVGGATMTQAAADAVALYVNDHADGNGVIVGKSAYIQQMSKLNLFAPAHTTKKLKIVIPEDLNYEGVFDAVLNKYCNKYELLKVMNIDLGTLFELVFDVKVKKDINEKEFMDELRTLNGNLKISLTLASDLAD